MRSLPDPFVDLYAYASRTDGTARSVRAISETLSNTLAPSWGGVTLAENVDREVLHHIVLTVYDEDLSFNDRIGVCFTQTEAYNSIFVERLFSGEVQVCRTEHGMVLRWQVRPHVP